MANSEAVPPASGDQSTSEAPASVGDRSVRSESIQAANLSDQTSKDDSLGFSPYVEAIAEFLTNGKTQPPLTLSIEGGWGSGKSSFMTQLQREIERIEQNQKKPKPKMVWFNAWRHDKVEALWAAFALEFLRQISTPRTRAEVIPICKGHFKLLLRRFKGQENWQDGIRLAFLSLFLLSLVGIIPVLFFQVGVKGVNQLSDQLVCRLSPKDKAETKKGDSQTNLPSPTPAATPTQSPGASPSALPSQAASPAATPASSASPSPSATPGEANPVKECLDDSPSGDRLESFLSFLLALGGFAGSTTGVVALLFKVGEIVGDPKNDLKKYLESPDYEKQVAFIEKFHQDFEKIVSAYAGKGNKVYVFIDDLDRCELTKAADLMQGLNLLISNDPHLIFLLGMDREKVAAGIALKQKDVLPYLQSSSVVLDTATQDSRAASKGLEYGYAFIEKFIQLPFQVPRASEEQVRSFLEEMSPQKPPNPSDVLFKYLLKNTEKSSPIIENQQELEAQPLEGIPQNLHDFISKDNENKPVLLLLIFSENGTELFSLLWLCALVVTNKLPDFGGQLREIPKAVQESLSSYIEAGWSYISKNVHFVWISCDQKIKTTCLKLQIIFDKKNGTVKMIRYLNQSQPPKPLPYRKPQRANQGQTEPTLTQSGQTTQNQPQSRREMMKIEVAGDSQAVRDIVLMVAPALDHNPRRIKQFINLFRLRVFIASNTGLFDEVKLNESDPSPPPLTLEQMGKFTALCLKYPLLRVDLEKDDKLLANLQRYALRDVYRPTDKYASALNGSNSQSSASSYDTATERWGSQPELVQLLRAGCDGDRTKLKVYTRKPENYSLEKIDVKQLLQISAKVDPLDRVPLRSEKGVDYKRLRELLRARQWREADQETLQVMLKAAQREKRGYLWTDDIEKFPCQDLQTIDQLWVVASKGKFGFSVQKRIWQECGSPMEYNNDWIKFCVRVGWLRVGWLNGGGGAIPIYFL